MEDSIQYKMGEAFKVLLSTKCLAKIDQTADRQADLSLLWAG